MVIEKGERGSGAGVRFCGGLQSAPGYLRSPNLHSGSSTGLVWPKRKPNVNFRKADLQKCGFWELCRANNEKNRWTWSCLEGCVLTAGRNRKLWWWTRVLGPGILWTWLDLINCGWFCLISLTCVCHQVLNTAKKSPFTPRTITITITIYIVLNVEE